MSIQTDRRSFRATITRIRAHTVKVRIDKSAPLGWRNEYVTLHLKTMEQGHNFNRGDRSRNRKLESYCRPHQKVQVRLDKTGLAVLHWKPLNPGRNSSRTSGARNRYARNDNHGLKAGRRGHTKPTRRLGLAPS